MTINKPVSESFGRFLDFFKLTQKDRLDGLDKSYFDPMTPEEKTAAFDLLESSVENSEESVHGIYLCNPDKAVVLFKTLIPKNLPNVESKREQEAAINCKILMAGIVANHELSKKNVNTLISLKKESISARNRANIYKQIPSDATTQDTLDFLKRSLFEEDNEDTLSYAIDIFLALYGLKFSFRDEKYKKIYSSLLNGDLDVKKRYIKDVESNNTVNYL